MRKGLVVFSVEFFACSVFFDGKDCDHCDCVYAHIDEDWVKWLETDEGKDDWHIHHLDPCE